MPVNIAPIYASLNFTLRFGKNQYMSPKIKVLMIILKTGKILTNPFNPIALAQNVTPTVAINKIQTMNAHAIDIKLFLIKGRSFFAFHIRFKLDSIALNMLAEPHKKPSMPTLAMIIDVCLIARIFFIISSSPIGIICFKIGSILSIIPWDEPRIKNDNDRSPSIRGNRLNMAEFTSAEASKLHRSVLNLLYAFPSNQKKFFIIHYLKGYSCLC